MISFSNIPRVYLVQGYTDLRKGIDGYASMIQSTYQLDVFQDALFFFCNRHRDKIKILYWDTTGFWLLYKRLEKGHFKWETRADGVISITHQQLSWLLDGLKIEQKTAFKTSTPKYV